MKKPAVLPGPEPRAEGSVRIDALARGASRVGDRGAAPAPGRQSQARSNRALARRLASVGAQAKLRVSGPDDPAEREADLAAAQVLSAGAGVPPALLRRGGAGAALMRRGGEDGEPPDAFASNLKAMRGGGASLPKDLRAELEPRFGAEFADVRVHTDAAAAEAAAAVESHAFTAGRDIFFAAGRFAPHTRDGRQLIAHELAHVLQQEPTETRARRSTGLARSLRASPLRIQRQEATRPLWAEAQRYVTEREVDEIVETGRERGQIWRRERRIEYELADTESTRALRAAARQLAAKQSEIARLRDEQQRFVSRVPQAVVVETGREHGQIWRREIRYVPQIVDPSAYEAKGAEIARAEREYAILRGEKARQHPILAASSDQDIARLGTAPPSEAAMIIGSELGFGRLESFKRFVLQRAQDRLTANQKNLDQWRGFVADQLAAVEVQRQAFAQIPRDFLDIAVRHGTLRAFHEWAEERNPYMRRVREQQMAGHWLACTGCHEAVRAWNQGLEEERTGAAWQSPAERLAGMAAEPRQEASVTRAAPPPPGLLAPSASIPPGVTVPPQSAAVVEAARRIGAILEPLGARGYKVIPEETMSLLGRATPEELRRAILRDIARRHSDYETLESRIGGGAVSYLELTPILSEFLPMADPDVRRAVSAEQSGRMAGQRAADVGAFLALLLSPLFPPLVLVGAGIELSRGWQTAQVGYGYRLGTGASNVFSPEQQAAAGELMAAGGLRMAMATATLAGGSPLVADWGATRVAILSDIGVTRALALRAAQGPISAAELEGLLRRGLAGRAAEGYLTWRGYQVLYRGQTAPSAAILSPTAREGGLPVSHQLYQELRAQGLSDLDIAAYTARWAGHPVPPSGQPLGGAGIPTTRIPGVASYFAQRGGGATPIIYVFRVPRGMAIDVASVGWGSPGGATQSLVEGEWVAFHQVGDQYIVRTIPAAEVPALMADAPPGQGWSLILPPAAP